MQLASPAKIQNFLANQPRFDATALRMHSTENYCRCHCDVLAQMKAATTLLGAHF
jgi:hypothetical protein